MDLSFKELLPLAPLTTLGIGGPARYFVEANTADQLVEAVGWARQRELPLLVLGGGSNLLIADEGFPGLVVRCGIDGIQTRRADGRVELTAGAGEDWDSLVSFCVRHRYSGVECLSGIPGRVGATPIQNVGAYGQEVRETIVRVDAVDLETLELVSFTNDECEFGYRESRFKHRDKGRYVVTSVGYSLMVDGEPAVRYAELERRLVEQGNAATLESVRATVLAIRKGKSMVLDPADPDARSAGSFFTNPIVSKDTHDSLQSSLADRVPSFPATDGMVKLPAAWLIERAGFTKGYGSGRAGLSTKHTLAIVNRGGAKASDVVDLAREIRDAVHTRFGVTLVPEPVFVGLEF